MYLYIERDIKEDSKHFDFEISNSRVHFAKKYFSKSTWMHKNSLKLKNVSEDNRSYARTTFDRLKAMTNFSASSRRLIQAVLWRMRRKMEIRNNLRLNGFSFKSLLSKWFYRRHYTMHVTRYSCDSQLVPFKKEYK